MVTPEPAVGGNAYVKPVLHRYGCLTALTGAGSGVDTETKGGGGQTADKRP